MCVRYSNISTDVAAKSKLPKALICALFLPLLYTFVANLSWYFPQRCLTLPARISAIVAVVNGTRGNKSKVTTVWLSSATALENSETRYLADTVVKTRGYRICDKRERRHGFGLHTCLRSRGQIRASSLPSQESKIFKSSVSFSTVSYSHVLPVCIVRIITHRISQISLSIRAHHVNPVARLIFARLQ